MAVRVRVGQDVCVGCINPAVVLGVVGAMPTTICLGVVDSACGEGQHGALTTSRFLPYPGAFASMMLVNVMMLGLGV